MSAALVAGALAWRWASRRLRLPCPAWLGWILSNPYTSAVASAETILDRAEVSAGMRVLDAGSGPGRVTIPAAKLVGPAGEVLALDVQETMLAQVRLKAAAHALVNIRTLVGSIDAGGLDPGTFDRALLVTVLGEIPDRESAVRALHTALRVGGILSVTEMIPDPHYQPRGTVRRLGEAAGFLVDQTHGTWLAFTMNLRKVA